ncbi:MAG: UPF0280 family protein [Coriobacteriia bacterium]|jgi:ApbE superfamily uncharacterized protein (UPF0280 family)|nr:UPF0280 family protein [Coriobacteriia bacterium]
MTFEPRTYRRTTKPAGLVCFDVAIKETDLHVCAARDLTDLAEDLVVRARWDLEGYIRAHPRFGETLTPIDVPQSAPEIVRRMADAARIARVGPMSAVAGAIAEYVARGLAVTSPEVIVENGGDIYLMGTDDRTVALWAGDSGVQGLGITVRGGLLPVSVCTSSGKVGHSESFGAADAVTVLSRNGALADATATALANRVRKPEDIERAIEAAQRVHGVLGVLVSVQGHLGAWGNVHLVSLGRQD